ncbi:MAG: hypothetical protein GTO40_06940 [Deltaproteobacteria bacterium]|nr:hypothetical protein [Deltaproteobacteria bacterium]
MVAAYSLVRLYLSRGSALLAACVGAFSLYTYIFSDVVYTELPFALATVMFVILIRIVPELGRLTAADMFGRVTGNLIAMPAAIGGALSSPIGVWDRSHKVIQKKVRSQCVPGNFGFLVCLGLVYHPY